MCENQKYQSVKSVIDAQKPLFTIWLRNGKYMKCVGSLLYTRISGHVILEISGRNI
jgi:hypothetical protein